MYKNQKEIHDFISYDELYILKHDLILIWIILTAYLVQHLIKIGYFKKIKIQKHRRSHAYTVNEQQN